MRVMTTSHFTVIPDFNAQSAKPVCYFTNLPKQEADTPQKQPHEVDHFILRGPEIEFEGYMDIRPDVIITTAREIFQMSTPEEVADLVQERNDLEEALKQAEEARDAANSRLQAMILQNAEQIVQIAGLEEALSQSYEDLYDPADLADLIDETVI